MPTTLQSMPLIEVEAASFEQQVPAMFSRLRAALSALIGAIPTPTPVTRAVHLQRALSIPNTLAWQVHRLANSPDPLAEGISVPGPSAMARLLEAAAERGVSPRILETASTTIRDLHALIKTHADDRSAFDSMVSGLNGGASSHTDLHHRRAAFKANSHIWGVQARTQLTCAVLRPSDRYPDRIELIGIRGLIDLKRLRRDAPWVVSTVRIADNDGGVSPCDDHAPLDPIGSGPTTVPHAMGISLLREFCSQPLPRFTCRLTRDGFSTIELEPTNVGNTSAMTCIMGDVYRNGLVRYRGEHDRVHRIHSMVRTPSQALVLDVLVQEGTFEDSPPKVEVYGDHRNVDPALPGRECDLLPMHQPAIHLGRGVDVVHTPDVPRYAEMLRHAFDRAGWEQSRLHVYRCRIEYPVMPSSVVMQFNLLNQP